MIYPMMLKVDFTALGGIAKKPKGLLVTLFVNWLVKPFRMALFAWLFIRNLFSAWIDPETARNYTAGLIILALVGCHAKPYDYKPTAGEMKEGPGVLSGEDGAFTVYDSKKGGVSAKDPNAQTSGTAGAAATVAAGPQTASQSGSTPAGAQDYQEFQEFQQWQKEKAQFREYQQWKQSAPDSSDFKEFQEYQQWKKGARSSADYQEFLEWKEFKAYQEWKKRQQ